MKTNPLSVRDRAGDAVLRELRYHAVRLVAPPGLVERTKLMALFLALLMCAALAACGQPAEKDDPAPAPSQSQTPAEDPSGGETKNLASFKIPIRAAPSRDLSTLP